MNNDLISRDEIKRATKEWLDDAYDFRTLNQVIDSVSAVDAEPVRHGRWIKGKWQTYPDGFVCSECSTGYVLGYQYCPNCGAKMDLEE